MSFPLMLVLQAAAPAVPAPAPAPASPPLAAIRFDLARYRPAGAGFGMTDRDCRGGDPTPIVVCARRGGGAYPFAEMARIFAARPLVAETGLAGAATARAYGEAVELAPGMVSNRIMVGIGLPF